VRGYESLIFWLITHFNADSLEETLSSHEEILYTCDFGKMKISLLHILTYIGRSDFLKILLDYLERTEKWVPLSRDGMDRTPLDVALERSNTKSTRYLLSYAAHLPIGYIARSVDSLCNLLQRYTNLPEIVPFLNSRTIEMPENFNAPKYASLRELDSILFFSFDTFQGKYSSKFEDQVPHLFNEEHQSNTLVSYSLVDLPGICQPNSEFFEIISKLSPDHDIFNSKSLSFLIRFKWRLFGKKFHIQNFMFFLSYALVFGFYSLFILEFKIIHDDPFWFYLPLIFELTLLAFLYFLLRDEFAQITQVRNLKKYLCEHWNSVDIMIVALNCIGFIFNWTGDFFESQELFIWVKVIYAFVFLLNGTRVFALLRGFETISGTCDLVIQMMRDIGPFMIIFFLSLVCFSSSFALLEARQAEENIWAIPIQNFIQTYQITLGYEIWNQDDSPAYMVGDGMWLLYLGLTAMNMIFLLNLLIAIMGSSVDRIQMSKRKLRNYQILQLLLEYEQLSRNEEEKYTHAFKDYVYVVQSLELAMPIKGIKWEGRIQAIEDGFHRATNKINQRIKTREERVERDLREINKQLAEQRGRQDEILDSIGFLTNNLQNQIQELKLSVDKAVTKSSQSRHTFSSDMVNLAKTIK